MANRQRYMRTILTDFRIRSLCFCFFSLTILGFTSCDKNTDEEINGNESESILVKIVASVVSDTKSESVPVVDGTPAVLNNGLLIFSKSDGTIDTVMQVLPGISGGGIIGISDLTSSTGVNIKDMKKTSSRIDFFGNVPSDVVLPDTGTDISIFISLLQNMSVLSDASGEVNRVGLYAHEAINWAASNPRAEMDATPIASRLEIVKFERDAVHIETLDIEGIFINNFYSRANLMGAVDDDDIIYYPATSVFEENGESYYATQYKGITFDYDKSPYVAQQNGVNYYPITSGKVWAYNIYSGEVPHIVVKFTNLTATQDYINLMGEDPFLKYTYWYLTITELHVGGQPFVNLEQGYVYSIQNIKVSPEDLKPIPEPEDEIFADVQVNIVPWIPVDASTTLPNLPW
ncbi:MAG: hypothetical protein LUF90_09295 [Rikenellaceae bacterium]|nr:hypothetical protein [Rikenellaceae bacterium]